MLPKPLLTTTLGRSRLVSNVLLLVTSLKQESILARCPAPPTKVTKVPDGTPVRKTWHIKRRHVVRAVFEALTGDEVPCLVGLVGDSGSGKTTAAAEIVRSTEVREAFSDGIIWLTVNKGAKGRISSLMMQLARLGREPGESDDSADYIKHRLKESRGRKGLKCLVVADNVWEKEVVSALQQTDMWILLSTRSEELVKEYHGEVVGVDKLCIVDAESILKKAAELPSECSLPDDALYLIEACGRVAMDLAFVGRWSTVRGRRDREAWSDAAGQVRREMESFESDSDNDSVGDVRNKRRKAILRAGFENLAAESEDERVPRLYLSLAVLPDGYAFAVKDAAVFLYDRAPSAEHMASVREVVGVLERWTIIRTARGNKYRMHDAHSGFARDGLLDNGRVRRPAVKGWVAFLSGLDAVRSIGPFLRIDLWQAVERVGGDGWAKLRPYTEMLEDMDGSNTQLRRRTIEAVGWFQQAQEDWGGGRITWQRLLEVEKGELGATHPFVLNTFGGLAKCAERLGNDEEMAQWREKERQGIPAALAMIHERLGAGTLDELDGAADELSSLAFTISMLSPGDRDQAEQLFRRSLAMQEATSDLSRLRLARTLQHLGVCVREHGRIPEATELLVRCLWIQKSDLGSDHEHVASTLHELSVCAQQRGELEQAEELLRSCLSIREAKQGPESFGVVVALHDLGVWIREAGRLKEAEDILKRCLSIKESTASFEDTQLGATAFQLGICVREAGRSGEAEELFRRCLSIEEKNTGPFSRSAVAMCELAVSVRNAGRLEEAEELLRRCLSMREAKIGAEVAQSIVALYELGVCVRKAGRLGEAEKLLRLCLSMEEAKLGPEDVGLASTLHDLGVCVAKAGRVEEAEELLRRCLFIQSGAMSPEDARLSLTRHELGVTLRKAGRLNEAERLPNSRGG